MKIRELLNSTFPSSTEKYRPNMNGVLVEIDPDYSPPSEDVATTPFLHPFQLDIRPILKEFRECEEFSDAVGFGMIDTPFVVDDNGKFIQTVTLKLTEDMRFYGRALVYQVLVSDTIIYQGDGLNQIEPVLKGACITPTVYDKETFEPKRRIVMEFSPEISAAGDDQTEVELKERLHRLLDEIIDFPEAFTKKPDRMFTIRGIFERVESDSEITVDSLSQAGTFSFAFPRKFVFRYGKKILEFGTDLSALRDPVEHTMDYTMLFFFERAMQDNRIGMGLGKYIIPKEMEDGITRELGNRPGKEQIEEYLRRNGRQDIIDKNNALANGQ